MHITKIIIIFELIALIQFMPVYGFYKTVFANNIDSTASEFKIIIKEPVVTRGDTNIIYSDVNDSKITKKFYISKDSINWGTDCKTSQGILNCAFPNSRCSEKLKDSTKYHYKVRILQQEIIDTFATTFSFQDATPPNMHVHDIGRFTNKEKFFIKYDSFDFICDKIDSSILNAKLFYKNEKTLDWVFCNEQKPGLKTKYSENITTMDSVEFLGYDEDGLYEFYIKGYDRAWKADNSGYDSNYESNFLNPDAKTEIYIDTKEPVSEIHSLSETQNKNIFFINYWAFDERSGFMQFNSGIKQIILFFEYKENKYDEYNYLDSLIFNVPQYDKFDTLKSNVDFTATRGNGFYKYSTIAIDSAGNRQIEKIKYISTIVDTIVPKINWIHAYIDSYKKDILKENWQNLCNSPYIEWYDPQNLSDNLFNIRIIKDSEVQSILDTTISKTFFDSNERNIHLPEGKIVFEVKSKSNAGLWSNNLNYIIRYDTTAPYAEIDKYNLNPLYSDSNFTIYFDKVRDNFSGVKEIVLKYQFKLKEEDRWSSAEVYPYTATFDYDKWQLLFNVHKAKGFGYYYFGTIASDSAGNIEEWETDISTLVDPEILAPAKLKQLSNYISSKEVKISWDKITQEKITSVHLQCAIDSTFDKSSIVDSSNWLSTEITEFILPSSNYNFEDGRKYWFRAQTKDKNNQLSEWSGAISCTFDFSAPMITINEENLKNGKWENNVDIPIYFSTFDSVCGEISGIYLYYRALDDSLWITNNNKIFIPAKKASKFSAHIDSIIFSKRNGIVDNYYEVFLGVQDKLGNKNFPPEKNQKAMDSFKLDLTPPSVIIESPFLSYPRKKINIKYMAVDNSNFKINSEIKSTTLYSCFSSYNSNSIMNDWKEVAIDLLNKNEFDFYPDSLFGIYIFKAVSKDFANNSNTSNYDSTHFPKFEIPRNGEIFGHSKPFEIRWWPKDNLKIKIFISIDDGKTYSDKSIVDSMLSGEYFWNPDLIPDYANCKLKICAKHDDSSQSEFLSDTFILDNIAPYDFEFLSPIGGEKWGTGKKYLINWSQPKDQPSVISDFKTEIFLNYKGKVFNISGTSRPINSQEYLPPESTSFTWKIEPDTLNDDDCKIILEVTDQANNVGKIESENFSIKPIPQIDSIYVFDKNTKWDLLDYAYPGWTNDLDVFCYLKIKGSIPKYVDIVASGSTSSNEISKSWIYDSMNAIISIQLPNENSEKSIICKVKNDYGESDEFKQVLKLDMIQPQITSFNCQQISDSKSIFIKVNSIDQNGTLITTLPPRLILFKKNDFSKPEAIFTDFYNGVTYNFSEDLDSLEIYLAVADSAGNISDKKFCNIKLNILRGDLLCNYPNPFDKKTTIQFKANGIDKIYIYDIFGNLVTTLPVPDDDEIKKIIWDGTNFKGEPIANGGYVCIVGKERIKIYVLR